MFPQFDIIIFFQTPDNEKYKVKKYNYEIEVERKINLKLQMILEQYQPIFKNTFFETRYVMGQMNIGNSFKSSEEKTLLFQQLLNHKIEADPTRDYLNLLVGENSIKIEDPLEIIISVDNMENEELKNSLFLRSD